MPRSVISGCPPKSFPIPRLGAAFLVLATMLPTASPLQAQTDQFQKSGVWSSALFTEAGYWAALTTSEKYENVLFAVGFSPAKNCTPFATYSQPSPPPDRRQPDGPYPYPLKFRVDRSTEWVVEANEAYASGEHILNLFLRQGIVCTS